MPNIVHGFPNNEDHGLTTKEYKQLKNVIERLIRDEALRRFAKKYREERRSKHEVRTPVNSNQNEHLRLINVIVEGSSYNKGKKKHTP